MVLDSMRNSFYLAYGSNLHPLRLQERISSASLRGTVVLTGARLCFFKRGQDGSGKCTLEPACPSTDVIVYGALYRLDSREWPILDGFEGLGNGYEYMSVEVEIGAERLHAWTYRAQPGFTDCTAKPFRWYRDLVLMGARYHGFPNDYVRTIARVSAEDDPDSVRRKTYGDLLRRITKYETEDSRMNHARKRYASVIHWRGAQNLPPTSQ